MDQAMSDSNPTIQIDPNVTVVMQQPAAQPTHRVRLLLSGGGNRAMVGCAGAIAYLAQHGWWDSIDEVVSVSGGSITNASLMTGGTETYAETFASLDRFYTSATTDTGQPWKDPKRFIALALMVTPLCLTIALALMALGIVPGPSVVDQPLVGLGIGLTAPTVCSLGIRRGAGAYLRNYLGSLTNGATASLTGFGAGRRQHVICASGLSTAHPYYLWGGGSDFTAGGDLSQQPAPHDPAALWGAAIQGDYSVADAVFASSSLPTLAQIKASVAAPSRPDRSELLIDGGISGIFGGQVSAGLKKQSEKRSSTEGGHIIVIDSGRHVRPPSRIGQAIQRLSIAGLLARWLKVSLETSYRRDLLELDDANLVRIAEGQEEHGPGADGVRVRFDELRTRTAQMGLANYDVARAMNAFVTGWVGAALCLDPACTIASVEQGLAAVGGQMKRGDEFAAYWRGLR